MTRAASTGSDGARPGVAPAPMTWHTVQSAGCTGTQCDVLCDSTWTEAARSEPDSARASATDANVGSSS